MLRNINWCLRPGLILWYDLSNGESYELNELIENADIVRFIKSRRIAWLGHVMRMDDKRRPKRIPLLIPT